MMNFSEYIQTYTGYGVTITIIDTGVRLESKNITHFKYHDSEITLCNIEDFRNAHGTLCTEEILKIAKNVVINDICVEENSIITEKALISALDYIDSHLDSDIICICLALEQYSPELAKILNKIKNTFIFASTSKGKVSYPADLPNVISVYHDNKINGVQIISDNVIAVNEVWIDSSSLACAYVSGLFALILEAKALWLYDDIKNSIFPNIKNEKSNENTFVFPERFISIFPLKYLKYKDNFINNLIGYYDEELKICAFDGNNINESLPVVSINHDERKKVVTTATIGDYFAGFYEDCPIEKKIPLQSHYGIDSFYINDISTPIIALTSFGYGASKFDTQVKLHHNIRQMDYNVISTTYNPMGLLLKDFYVFEYPQEIICPKMIYSLNRFVYELSIETNPDIFLLNIAGSIRGINYHNTFDMGMLTETYLKSFKIDIVLLCVNVNVNWESILFEIERLKATGINDVILVVSENMYDPITFYSSAGLKYYECNIDMQKEYAEILKTKYKKENVYMLNDFDDLKTVEKVVNLLK